MKTAGNSCSKSFSRAIDDDGDGLLCQLDEVSMKMRVHSHTGLSRFRALPTQGKLIALDWICSSAGREMTGLVINNGIASGGIGEWRVLLRGLGETMANFGTGSMDWST